MAKICIYALLLLFVCVPAASACEQCAEHLGGACRDYKCGTALDSSEDKRTFVYAVAGARYLGVLNAGERIVSCGVPATAIELRISPSVAMDLRISQPATKLTWQVSLSGVETAKPIKLSLARGTYEISATADHFAVFKATGVPSAKPAPISISLARLPRLIGTVIDGVTGRPIAHARVITDMQGSTVTYDQGHFALEAEPGNWPELVGVQAGCLGE